MTPQISIGSNIFRLRKQERLTQDDLASYLGVTKASVSKWETGQSYPDIKQSLMESVSANPVFAVFADEPRFKRVVASLEEVVR